MGLEAPTILRPFVTQCSQSFTPCSGHLAPHLTGDRQTDRQTPPCSGHLAPHLTGDRQTDRQTTPVLATLHHTLLGTGRQTDRQPLFWPPYTTPYWGQAGKETDTPCSGPLTPHFTGDRQADIQTPPVLATLHHTLLGAGRQTDRHPPVLDTLHHTLLGTGRHTDTPCSGHLAPHLTADRQTGSQKPPVLATLHHTLLGTGRQAVRNPLLWPSSTIPYWRQADRQTDIPCSGHLAPHLTGNRQTDRQTVTPCSGHVAPHLTGDRQTDRHPLCWPPCTTPYWGQADRQTDTPCSGHLAPHLTGDRQTGSQKPPVVAI